MNSNIQILKTSLNSKWNRQGLLLAILSAVSLLISYGGFIIDNTNRKLTPDPHEIWALEFFFFWPLNGLSFIFAVLAIKKVILIHSIRGKQSLVTSVLLLLVMCFWTYQLIA